MDIQSWLILALAAKISNLATVYFLIYFAHIWKNCCWWNYLWPQKILLQNIRRFVRYLGPNLAQNEKTRKVGYLCHLGYPWPQWKFALKNFSHIDYDMASLPYKIHEWFSMSSYKKNLTNCVQKVQILCNTQVLIFTIFHYTIVTSQIHYQILEFYCVLCKVNCLFKWNQTEKFCIPGFQPKQFSVALPTP